MSELEDVLARLGLSDYLDKLLVEGFDSWATVCDITEADLAHCGVKRGHRRILQREIARQRGIPESEPIPSRYQHLEEPPDDLDDVTSPPGFDGNPSQSKRKYKRHPKPDPNAPAKPPSAYVVFANSIREEFKGSGHENAMTFADMARYVGERWQALGERKRAEYRDKAAEVKREWGHQMEEYRKTDLYKAYERYLADFPKSKDASDASRKRPKLETLPTSSSMSTHRSTRPSTSCVIETDTKTTSHITSRLSENDLDSDDSDRMSGLEENLDSPPPLDTRPSLHTHSTMGHHQVVQSRTIAFDASNFQEHQEHYRRVVHSEAIPPPNPTNAPPQVSSQRAITTQQPLEAVRPSSELSNRADSFADSPIHTRIPHQLAKIHIQPVLSYQRGRSPSPPPSVPFYLNPIDSSSSRSTQRPATSTSTTVPHSDEGGPSVYSVLVDDKELMESVRTQIRSRTLPLPRPQQQASSNAMFEQASGRHDHLERTSRFNDDTTQSLRSSNQDSMPVRPIREDSGYASLETIPKISANAMERIREESQERK